MKALGFVGMYPCRGGEIAVKLTAQCRSILTATDRGAGHHYMLNPDLLRLINDLIKIATETFMA